MTYCLFSILVHTLPELSRNSFRVILNSQTGPIFGSAHLMADNSEIQNHIRFVWAQFGPFELFKNTRKDLPIKCKNVWLKSAFLPILSIKQRNSDWNQNIQVSKDSTWNCTQYQVWNNFLWFYEWISKKWSITSNWKKRLYCSKFQLQCLIDWEAIKVFCLVFQS